MSLVDHARRELELCGQFDEDPAYAQSLVAAVAAFASYGHSGGSAGCGIDQLTTLLRFEPLSPLTSDPAEWVGVGEQDGKPLFQSARRSEAFSVDGGRTYYLLSDRERGERRLRRAWPPGLTDLERQVLSVLEQQHDDFPWAYPEDPEHGEVGGVKLRADDLSDPERPLWDGGYVCYCGRVFARVHCDGGSRAALVALLTHLEEVAANGGAAEQAGLGGIGPAGAAAGELGGAASGSAPAQP